MPADHRDAGTARGVVELPVVWNEGACFRIGDKVTVKSTGEILTVRVVHSNAIWARRLRWYERRWVQATLAVLVGWAIAFAYLWFSA